MRPAPFGKFVVLGLALSVLAPAARAVDEAWSTNPATANFSGTNWTPGQVPGVASAVAASGDSLYFGTSAITSLTNDLTGASFSLLTFNSGANAFTLGGNAFTLNGNIVNNSSSLQTITANVTIGANVALTAGSATITGTVSGAQPFGNTGSGTLTVTDGRYTGNVYVNNLAGTYNVTAAGSAMTGGVFVDKGTLGIAGTFAANATTNNFVVGTAAGAGNAVLNSSATISRFNLAIGSNGSTGVTATRAAAVYQTGGAIVLTQGASTANFAIGSSNNGKGYYALSGGSLTSNEIGVGGNSTNSVGVADVSGGTLTSNGYLAVGRGGGTSSGVLNVTGGTVEFGKTLTAGPLDLNWATTSGAVSVVNVGGGAGAAAVTGVGSTTQSGTFAGKGLNLAATTTAGTMGVVNLRTNGVLTVSDVVATNAAPTALLNFNGGTLKATSTNLGATFMTGTNIDGVYVHGSGGTIDNSGTNITVGSALLAPTGNGVGSVSVSQAGSGYIGAPMVTFTGGGGVGATGYAVISGGTISSVVVTNPGTGYTSAPTVVFTGGGASTVAVASTGTFANISGGMTFSGAGTTTLTGVNTYTGNTAVNAGTLNLADNAGLKFTIGANGVSNKLTGTGSVTLDGDFTFDLTGAGTGAGSSWTIVDVGTLNESFGGTFQAFSTLGSFTNNGGGIWSINENSVTYQFNAATGILGITAVPEPGTWSLMLGGLCGLVAFQRRRNARRHRA